MAKNREEGALRRSSKNRVFMGLVGGVAEYFQLSSFRLRLFLAIAGILSGVVVGLAAYLVMCWIVPSEAE